MTKPRIELEKVRNFGELFDVVIQFTKQEIKPILLSLSYLLPFALIATVFEVWFRSEMQFNLLSIFRKNPQDIFSSFISWKIFIMYFFKFLVYIVSILIINSYLVLYNNRIRKSPKPTEVIQTSLINLGGAFGVFIITLMVLAVAFLILIGLIFIMPMGSIFWIIIFLLIFLYLAIGASLSYISLIHNKGGAFSSIIHSFDLIKENWFLAFAFMFLFNLIISFAQSGLGFPRAILSMILTFTSMKEEASLLQKILYQALTAVEVFLGYFLSIIGNIAVGVYYFYTLEKQEAPGLTRKINLLRNRGIE